MWFRIALFVGIYAAAVAQTSTIEQPQSLQVCWLILVASFAMWRLPSIEAAGWAAVIGVICDAVAPAPAPLGLHVAALGMATWSAAICRERWLGQSLAAYGALTMVVTAAVVLAVAAGRMALGEDIGPLPRTALIAAGAAAATGLCGLFAIIAGRTCLYAGAANGLLPRNRLDARAT
jgi:cell shape-determining protein MreD